MKTFYILEQTRGQLALQNRAKPNAVVLKDPRVSKENRNKIKLVIQYKKHFYKYFNKKPTRIYNQTTILSSDAVTQLVISSPWNKIEAKKECFPIMGCFPYIGFFKQEKANKYIQRQKDQGFETFKRPVYAYSTLGHFDDTILSSFFHFNEEELAELIFHELFHTIFFIKDNVDLNENLANYFGVQMVNEYFKRDVKKIKKQDIKRRKLKRALAKEIGAYQKSLEEKPPISKEEALSRREGFLKGRFFNNIKNKCDELKLKKCSPLRQKWNNARFAAFLTYEKKVDQVGKLHQKLGGSLLEFYFYLEKSYREYKDKNSNESFESYLLGSI